MLTIWKFPTSGELGAKIEMPSGAQILTAQPQGGTLMIWAIVDTDAPKVKRQVHVIGTGWTSPFPDNVRYVATVQQPPFVWHVFIGPEEA
jgi:hypothetical protein